jgi:beta-lactam-binding protein with PASTA domain
MTPLTSRTALAGLFVVLLTLPLGGCSKEKLTVPKVTGEESDVYEVYDRLTDEGFAVEITHRFRTGPSCECRNPIVEQWPPAGTRATSGSQVEITVGGPGPTGSPQIRPPDPRLRLPNFVGQGLDAVDEWLSAHRIGWVAELPPLPATTNDDLLEDYVVTSQDRSPGSSVPAWNFVALEAAPTKEVLAKWRETSVVVPFVSADEHLLGAYARLHARGLRVATDRRLVNGPYIPVIAQRPRAAVTVRRGTTVKLFLDPKLDQHKVCCDSRRLSMPNFVGRNLGPVADWLERLGLYWEVDAPALPPTSARNMFDPYVVTSQDPSPGTTIPEQLPEANIKPIQLRARLVKP